MGPRGVQGAKGLLRVVGIQGPLGVQEPIGSTGGQGELGWKGEKGIQCGNSDVLSVLDEHLLIQVCFINYHVSEDMSNIIELSGGVETLRSVSAYHEPAWHFNAKFVNGQGHGMANVQKTTGHDHFVEMKNSAYHCPYDLVSNKVNAIYIIYKIRKYDSTGSEHYYL